MIAWACTPRISCMPRIYMYTRTPRIYMHACLASTCIFKHAPPRSPTHHTCMYGHIHHVTFTTDITRSLLETTTMS